MKKVLALVVVLAVMVAFTGVAFAADNPAPANKAATKAPEGKAAPAGIKAVVKGKISSKEGRRGKMYEIAVTEAKSADGKAMDELKGQSLRLGAREKADEVAKFDGKSAEVTGSLMEGRRGGKMLRVESIK
jgi:hypothetical protein